MSDLNYTNTTKDSTCAVGERDSPIPLHLAYYIYYSLTSPTNHYHTPFNAMRTRAGARRNATRTGGPLCSALLSGARHVPWVWVTSSSADMMRVTLFGHPTSLVRGEEEVARIKFNHATS